MKKYEYQLQTLDMEEKTKVVTIELKDDQAPTAQKVIEIRLLEYYKPDPSNILAIYNILDIAREMLERLTYFEIREVIFSEN